MAEKKNEINILLRSFRWLLIGRNEWFLFDARAKITIIQF